MNDNAGVFAGMDGSDARKAVVRILRTRALL